LLPSRTFDKIRLSEFNNILRNPVLILLLYDKALCNLSLKFCNPGQDMTIKIYVCHFSFWSSFPFSTLTIGLEDVVWTCFSLNFNPCGEIFFIPLRGKWPQKWSPRKSALLSNWLVTDKQMIAQKNQKRSAFSMDMSKYPKNVHLFRKMSINKKCQNYHLSLCNPCAIRHGINLWQFSLFFLIFGAINKFKKLIWSYSCNEKSIFQK